MSKEIEEIWKELEKKEKKEEIKINKEDIDTVMKILRKRSVEDVRKEIKRMIKDIEKEIGRIEEKEIIEDVKMMKIYGLRSKINILNWVLQLIIKYC